MNIIYRDTGRDASRLYVQDDCVSGGVPHPGKVLTSNAAHQFVPTEFERRPKSGSHLYRGNKRPCFDHLEITAADVGTLGKLLLREVGQISKAIDILAEFDAGGFSHPLRMQKSTPTESEVYLAL
jgi:hypothetical protein